MSGLNMPEIFRTGRGRARRPGAEKLPPGTELPFYFTKMEIRATPSIRAASVMAITIMGEEAPGLRPVASGADEANAEAGADGDEAETYVAGQFGQGGHCDRIDHVIGMVYVFC
jgi:hypothetical protein